MKNNLVDEVRKLFAQSKNWLSLEIEYAKLTIAEKLTLLLGTLIIGFVCLLIGVVILILLAFSLVELFKMMMPAALAFLSTAGVMCLLLLILFLLRRQLLLNPIARLISKVFLDKNQDKDPIL